MPLRDHFRPPVSKKSSWEGFHAMWPTCIVQQLRKLLPPGYVAEPRDHTTATLDSSGSMTRSSGASQIGRYWRTVSGSNHASSNDD